jgi:hypothetical protein
MEIKYSNCIGSKEDAVGALNYFLDILRNDYRYFWKHRKAPLESSEKA